MHTRLFRTVFNLAFIFIFLASLIGVQPVSAQTEPPGGDRPVAGPAGLTYGYDSETGRLNFVGGDADTPLLDPAQTLGALSDVDAGAQVLAQFAPAFGLNDPVEELRLERVDEHAGSAATLRYQQQYQGIPVLGGELLLNRDEQGKVLSLNGEVSPDLSLRSTHPTVSAARARATAVAGMKTWHGLAAAEIQASEPELWIYDPAIFEPSDAAPVLVWRIELTGPAANELVLVNAVTGRVALHFNQVNASAAPQEEPPLDVLYVSPNGSDGENTCRSPLAPCQTISRAVRLGLDGSVILTQAGEYFEQFKVEKSITISGGWNANFTAQEGQSTLSRPLRISTEITGIGLYTAGSILTISRLTIAGFDAGLTVNNDATVHLNHCSIIQNTIGLKLYQASVSIENCSFSENITAIHGGGRSNLTIDYSSFVDNRGEWLSQTTGFFPPSSIIKNSLIARNAGQCSATYGEFVSAGHNLFDTAEACTGHFHEDPTDLFGVDPQVSALIYGTYHAISATSPAVNGADPDDSCPETDIRGVSRGADGGCDIGAYEFRQPGPASSILPKSFGPWWTLSDNPQRVPFATRKQTAMPGKEFLFPLEVFVLDANGSPVSNAAVDFDAPDSGASAVFIENSENQISAFTNNDGIATVFIRANDETGWYQVHASLAEGNPSTIFNVGNGVGTLFVDPTRPNYTSSCRDPLYPCPQIRYAIENARPTEIIQVASGVLTRKEHFYSLLDVGLYLRQNFPLSIVGGWNSDFTEQNGETIIRCGEKCIGVALTTNIPVVLDRINLNGNEYGIRVNSGTMEILNSAISQSTIGLTVNNGQVSIQNTSFTGNQTGIDSIGGKTEVQNSVIARNTLGIHNSGEIKLLNVTISHNQCTEEGNIRCSGTVGLKNTENGIADLINVTLAHNRSFPRVPANSSPYPFSSGLQNSGGTVTLKNSLLAYNLSESGYDCSGEITSLGHNLIHNARLCNLQPAEGDLIGAWNQPINPLVGYFGDNGDDMDTLPLLSGSPAIDHADLAACPATDERGQNRPDGTGCDIGAYEGALESEPLPNVIIYTAGNHYLCETPQSECTYGENMDADRAYQYLQTAFHFFLNRYGYVSIDHAGMPILATVDIGEGAAWTGRRIDFGHGYVVDDVVMHEYAHGITQKTSRLLYYYQSGAISESYSDMWGEYFDLIDSSSGNDDASVRWLLGEDLPSGAVRSMSDPGLYQHPDSMSSKLYWRSPDDNGGVHANSGINNKAVYLMVEGGVFNKLSIAPLGWDKVLHLYYYTQTHLLTSGAGYDDLYNALNQACSVMTGGPEGITGDDCLQVRKALDAVEMSKAHKTGFNPDASTCPTGTYQDPNLLFHDDFEHGDANWTFGALSGNARWSVVPGNTQLFYAASGDYALFGNDYDTAMNWIDQVSNTYAALTTGIKVPAGERTVLYFHHAYAFEHFTYRSRSYFIDGAILEYTINDGATWLDAKALFEAGQNYPGRLYNGQYDGFNPMRSRYAFLGESHGYVASRYNLTRLAGKTVRFRWRMGTDYTGSFLGWAVDDVAIYRCVGKPAIPLLSVPANSGLLMRYQEPHLDWRDASSAQTYDVQIASDAAFTSLVQNVSGVAVSELTLPEALLPDSRYYWRVRAINAAGILSNWSRTYSFRTGMIPPELIDPADGSTASLRPTFQWNATNGTVSYYTIQISKYANFSRTVVNIRAKTTAYTPTTNLTAATRYYWRVRANGANTSDWSPVFAFTTP